MLLEKMGSDLSMTNTISVSDDATEGINYRI